MLSSEIGGPPNDLSYRNLLASPNLTQEKKGAEGTDGQTNYLFPAPYQAH